MDANRKTAYLALMDVESRKAYSNLAINHQIIVNRPNSQGFVRELVYGVLESKLTLDYYIDQLLTDGIDSVRLPELTIIRMGIYQLVHEFSAGIRSRERECHVGEEILPGQERAGQRSPS